MFYLFFGHAGSSLLCVVFLCVACGKQGLLFVVLCGPHTALASLVAKHRMWSVQTSVAAACGYRSCSVWALGAWASVVVAQAHGMVHGLSCSAACRIFLDQASNPPALAGTFLSTVLPGKSRYLIFEAEFVSFLFSCL